MASVATRPVDGRAPVLVARRLGPEVHRRALACRPVLVFNMPACRPSAISVGSSRGRASDVYPRMTQRAFAVLDAHVLPAVRRCRRRGRRCRPPPARDARRCSCERHLALDDVEELHLPGLDDHLVGLDAPRPRPERGHRPPGSYPGRAPPPARATSPTSRRRRRPGSRPCGVTWRRPAGGRLEERADRDPERAGQLAEGRQRRGEPPRLDLRHHAGREAGLLGELALLQRPLGPEGLDPLAERGHALRRALRAGRPAAAAPAPRRRAPSSCDTGGSGRCCRAAWPGRYAASAAALDQLGGEALAHQQPRRLGRLARQRGDRAQHDARLARRSSPSMLDAPRPRPGPGSRTSRAAAACR